MFIAFKSLGDAKGFMFCAKNGEDSITAILGDSVRVDLAKSLLAVSPLPAQFRLIKDGKTIAVSAEDQYQFAHTKTVTAGVYRVELHIRLGDQLIPWVYSNPIYVY